VFSFLKTQGQRQRVEGNDKNKKNYFPQRIPQTQMPSLPLIMFDYAFGMGMSSTSAGDTGVFLPAFKPMASSLPSPTNARGNYFCHTFLLRQTCKDGTHSGRGMCLKRATTPAPCGGGAIRVPSPVLFLSHFSSPSAPNYSRPENLCQLCRQFSE
jgi:hypothetical protein